MVTKKKIELGAIDINEWTPTDGKMFSYDFYYTDKEYRKNVTSCPPTEVVLPPNQKYTLVIDYPVKKPYKTTIRTGRTGFTRIQLADFICQQYRKMYAEEDESVGIPTGNIPGMFIRDRSFGKYGIWGHYITDLVLVSAEIKGSEIHLGVDS